LFYARFEFAEQFGVNPADVGKVDMQTWLEWLMWRKTKASRDTWQYWRTPGEAKQFTPAQRELFDWAAWPEGY